MQLETISRKLPLKVNYLLSLSEEQKVILIVGNIGGKGRWVGGRGDGDLLSPQFHQQLIFQFNAHTVTVLLLGLQWKLQALPCIVL